MRIYQTPVLLHRLFPDFTWRKKTTRPVIYLTFDDGPIPEVTEFVLDQLQQFQAKATFFCVGENILKHPEIAVRILEENHQIGNHTQNHLNGWKTSLPTYLDNIDQCQQVLKNVPLQPKNAALFRPPYGRITTKQAAAVKADFSIIMWDVLSYDFDATLAPEECLRQTIKHTRPGSLVVFHDSQKARRNMEFALPRFLEHFSRLGFTFETL